jgi:DNA-binding response OmpR family regulator
MNDERAVTAKAAGQHPQGKYNRLDELQENLLKIHQHVQQQNSLRQPSTKTKVLVVDGSEQLLKNITDFLAEREILTVSTTNGLEALHHFHNKHFDLALCAINISGLNGNILARYIKSHSQTVPVIAHTRSIWLAEDCFDAILEKPVELEILLQQILLHIDKRKGQIARPQH